MIRQKILCILLIACVSSCEKKSWRVQTEVAANKHPELASSMYQPDIDIPALFARVQLEKIYLDSKTFVDAAPKQNPRDILAEYQLKKSEPQFDLKAFVETHFDLPQPVQLNKVDVQLDMLEHLKKHWPTLLRNPQKTSEFSTLVQLPHPYIVPGGRFREMFYWDSYFTIIGLLGSDQDALALDMIDNFAYLIDQFGHIPNGNRSYFLSRSQPPFFAAMLKLYAEKHGMESIVRYTPQLEKEYAYWMDDKLHLPTANYVGQHLVVMANGDYFNRYYGSRDVPRAEAFNKESLWAEALPVSERPLFYRNLRAACESGWDFSSRWFADGKNKITVNTMDIIPVDLSSLMLSLETTLADLYAFQHQTAQAEFYNKRANTRKELIRRYHFDSATGSYQDYNFVSQKPTGQLSIAMAFPLFFGAANDDEAKQVAATIRAKFLQPGGVVTTLAQTDEQWDYPNGWAPMQYIAVKGLLGYHEKPLAFTIAQRWLAVNEKVYRDEGKMMEKYNVVDLQVKAGGGNYPIQDGFGWTNGVDIALYDLLKVQ